ncbi:hypothetical protein HYALB_00013145 [Hymenoscyphus albidus]|uniref:Uncharacterized protein n=1 Tax=Hymenoscyphus albidus TaxID=595503 RepID=A0A9N9LSU1_9HELO|nr:hypothetical protein HYALB_00013145 [Hymenoscyphus albidus]
MASAGSCNNRGTCLALSVIFSHPVSKQDTENSTLQYRSCSSSWPVENLDIRSTDPPTSALWKLRLAGGLT